MTLHTLKIEQITKISLILFILSLFFPIRHVFFTNSAYLTGAYSDFTSFSLYLSDIFLFIMWWSVLISRGGARNFFHHVVKNIKWLFFWLILAFLWHYRENSTLNWYFLLKYAELIVAYGTIATIFKDKSLFKPFFWLFSALTFFQSIFAIWQFVIQKSIGLKILGEQVLNPNILGVAKIVSGGTKLIRGYGTFPHPNLLAAFLLFGIFITIYLLINTSKKWQIFLLNIMVFVNILGLCVTFSRAGYFALGVGLILFFGYIFWNLIKDDQKINLSAWMPVFVVLISILTSFFIFRPYILTRATITDQATIERSQYNKIGLKMIKDKPIFGIGIGDSVLHMEQYIGQKLEPWQKQPIHNYFLLSAAELGIPGALILIWIFASHLKSLILNLKSKIITYRRSSEALAKEDYLLLATFSSFLVLMFFDHYFYTLQQTQMLLWVILGLIAVNTKNTNHD